MSSVMHCFKMPTPLKITSRTSGITNAFANAIIPVIEPTEEEIAEALSILGLDANDLRCAYCGDTSTEWDHLRPLIKDQRPTGYISEIANLVPACGKCNQSKGNKDWHVWMVSDAQLSPKTKRVPDLEQQIQRLEAFEAWRNVQPIDLAAMVGKTTWDAYWQQWQAILNEMQDAQRIADEIKNLIAEKHQQSLEE